MSEYSWSAPTHEAAAQLAIIGRAGEIVWRSVVVVFATEFAVMLILRLLGMPFGLGTALLDSLLLSVIALPVLYAVILRPMAALAAEQAAASAEARFETVARAVEDGLVVFGWERKIQFANPAAERMLGYAPGALLGADMEALMPEDWARQFRDGLKHYQATGESPVAGKGPVEVEAQRKNGERFPVELSVSSVMAGDETHFVVVIRDISERKRAEEALRESEERFRSIFEYAAIGISFTDLEGHPLHNNKAMQQMLGYTDDELRGMTFAESTYPDDLSADLELFRELVAGKLDHYQMEKRYIRKDGRTVWGRLTVSLVRGADNQPLFAGAVVEDITERKRAEEELRQAEEKYRGIFEEAIVGIFQTTPDGRYLSVNPTMAHLYGYDSPEELMASRTDIGKQAYVDPNRREEFKRLMEERGVVRDFEYQVYRKDGSKIWFLENARAVRDASGKVMYYIGAVEDVTERRRAEAALRESERRLRRILDALPVAVRIVQGGKVVFANPADAQLYGYGSAAEEMGADAFSQVAEEDRERVKGYAQRRAAGEEVPRCYEVHAKRRDGSIFPVEVTAERYVHAGTPASLVVLRDLTERKRLQMYEQILPVCCVCGKIRDDSGVEQEKGTWGRLDQYVARHSSAQVSHTFCPDCYQEYRKREGLS